MAKNGNGKNGNGRKRFGKLIDEPEEGTANNISYSHKPGTMLPPNFGQRGSDVIRELKKRYPKFFKKRTVQSTLAEFGTIDPQALEVHIRDHRDNRS